MTYIFEGFVKEVGKKMERDFSLPAKSCWFLFKGGSKLSDLSGLAGLMAESEQDSLFEEDVLKIVATMCKLDAKTSRQFLKQMVEEGLLVNEYALKDGSFVTKYKFPYQRFSDHLIARYLLNQYLDISSEQTVRRSFYANRMLGRIFKLNQWKSEFQHPGLTAAIMLEFPERIKGFTNPMELFPYLPKDKQLLYPVTRAFLDTAFWRNSATFNEATFRLIHILLAVEDRDTRNETFNLLFALVLKGHRVICRLVK